MTWRVVDDEPRTEAMHHALDDVLTDRLDAGEMPPTLRFWYRQREGVAMGRFQAYDDEVEADYVDDRDIEVVRRITGGGAMFVQPGNVITYSMYLPRDRVSDDVETSYAELDRWAIDALDDLGLDVTHEPLNDITHPDGKIGGAAQLRRENAVLHHVTMSYDLDVREMLRVLRIGKVKVSDKAVKSAEKRVAVMTDYLDETRAEVIGHLTDHFVDTFGGEMGSFTDDELAAAEERAREQFATDDWNRRL
ncbi:biotin/lipoate A/B protein ligase family protein [Halobacteriaceae archaeon GCM10025711]